MRGDSGKRHLTPVQRNIDPAGSLAAEAGAAQPLLFVARSGQRIEQRGYHHEDYSDSRDEIDHVHRMLLRSYLALHAPAPYGHPFQGAEYDAFDQQADQDHGG